MMRKVYLMLCSSALVSAGFINTDYSPPTSISYSSVSTPTIVKTVSSPAIEKTIIEPTGYTKIYQSPPSYESLLTTKESKFQTPDGTQHSTFSKSFDSAYSSLNKYESKSAKDGDVLANTIPSIYSTDFHSPIVYHPHTTYAYSSPLIHAPVYSKSVSVPLTYTTHSIPLTKTIVSPTITSYTTPVVSNSKTISSGLSAYSTPFVHTVHSPTFAKSVSLPVTYTSHEVPSTKTITSTNVKSYVTPITSKAKVISSGLSSYSSHGPVIEAQPIKTTLTYSEAPVVSHMSFSGLGANYAW